MEQEAEKPRGKRHGSFRLIVVLVLLVGVVWFLDRYVTVIHARPWSDQRLKDLLAVGMKDEIPFSLRLCDAMVEDWDRVYILGPYDVVMPDFLAKSGILWLGFRQFVKEHEFLLIFVRNREVVGHLTVHYKDLYFDDTYDQVPLRPDVAIFEVDQSDRGEGRRTWDWPSAVLTGP